jgi:hypothetical protein
MARRISRLRPGPAVLRQVQARVEAALSLASCCCHTSARRFEGISAMVRPGSDPPRECIAVVRVESSGSEPGWADTESVSRRLE